MTSYPMTPAMAALRSLRRAAWWRTPDADLVAAVNSLSDPLRALERDWWKVSAALSAYADNPSTDCAEMVQVSLRAFDASLATFFGPSGWEPQRPKR